MQALAPGLGCPSRGSWLRRGSRYALLTALVVGLGACAGPQVAPDCPKCESAQPPTGGSSSHQGTESAATHAALEAWEADVRRAGLDPATFDCNPTNTWNPILRDEVTAATAAITAHVDETAPELDPDSRAHLLEEIEEIILWRAVRTVVLGGGHHNVGLVRVPSVKRADGQPLIIFRTGITAGPSDKGSCFRSLVEDGGVRHALNLYSGQMPTGDLDEAERATITEAAGTYFQARNADKGLATWREHLRENNSPEVHAEVSRTVARIINEEVLAPGGAAPTGNVHVHCGGGMHRTGMLMGVIERCLNSEDAETIAAHYKHHVGYHGPGDPGGFEQENLDFVMSFDCSLLMPPMSLETK